MANKQSLNKQIFKKWWFWVAAVVILGAIGLATGNSEKQTDTSTKNSSQTATTLATVNKADYTGKEALVAFKDLKAKGYTVTAKYVNENLPDYKRDLTHSFDGADLTSCSDRLGFDAYIVGDVAQTGDNIAIALKDVPTNNQTCPAGTTDDRS
ncbi:MAG TPA: hypothetical protein PLT04_04225 [Candidatus Saccharibacteria bacterium]|nr:hypothetical protein [Candidatus Saccharibacteria bacterium]